MKNKLNIVTNDQNESSQSNSKPSRRLETQAKFDRLWFWSLVWRRPSDLPSAEMSKSSDCIFFVRRRPVNRAGFSGASSIFVDDP